MIRRMLFELGVMMEDRATGLKGMLTHYELQTGGNEHYNFQPRGLNPETGTPVDAKWITEDRVKGCPRVACDLPQEVLETAVTDRASGFKGIATGLVLHINGCIHVLIQAKGLLKKTGAMIEQQDLDIRRLSGSKIPALTKKVKKASEKKHPSPSPMTPFTP